MRVFSQTRTKHLEYFTGKFRIHPEGSTQSNVLASGEETLKLYEQYLPKINNKGQKKALRKSYYLFKASIHFHGGSSREVKNSLRELAGISPGSIFGLKYLLYYFFSSFGDKFMQKSSKLLRNLANRKILFGLNDLISKPFS